MKKIKKEDEKKILTIFIIILSVLDQISKIFILKANKEFTIIKNVISLKLEESTYVDSSNFTYILLTIIIIMAIIRYISNDNSFIKFNSKIILSFAISGAIGNLIDRLFHGYVINFIHITNFTSINLAYCYIFIAWIGMAVVLTKYTKDRMLEKKMK